jgi:hypothetical protein
VTLVATGGVEGAGAAASGRGASVTVRD